ncbi:MAG: hypothetical protein ACD_28C00108G0013 [uncultured bacterium]|nr:MAG: hypothetical protein ACD_28C00108G0013 [uncultured bacterium]
MKKNFSFLSILIILAMTLASTGCSDSNSPAPDAGGYVTNSSGLKYKDIMVGTGDTAEVGKTLSMHYVGTLTDGSKFDSSRDRGTPFEFTLGMGEVIQGWDEGVEGMKESGKRELVIPYQLAYGEQGIPGVIPAKSTLVFEVELLEVQ